MKAIGVSAQSGQAASMFAAWKSPLVITAGLLGAAFFVHAIAAEPGLTSQHIHISGSIAGKLSLLAFLLLPFLITQRRRLNLRYRPLAAITRILSRGHIPIAVIVLGATAAHVYLAATHSLVANFRNITGLLTLLAMILLYGSGFIRTGNWRKIHLAASIIFIGTTLLHIATGPV